MEIRPYRISNEFQFLIFACHYPFDTTHSKKIHTLITTHQLKWDKVMRLAITHRVIPLLYKNILQVERSKELLPLEFSKQLKLLAQKMIHQNLLNTHHSLKFLRCFSDENIRVIPYKGAILAIELYGDVGMRVFSDFDFLIDFKDLVKVQSILEAKGFIPEKTFTNKKEQRSYFSQACEYNFDLYEGNERIFHAEPHWLFISPLFGIDIAINDILQYTVEGKLLNEEITVLDKDCLPIMMAIHHGGKDTWSFLKHICDWQAFLSKYGNIVNWKRTLTFAKKYDIENLIYISVGLSHYFFKRLFKNLRL